MLEELAPKVLCKRWHQRQADGIVEEWKMAIRRARREDEAADEAREAAREARAEREAERETAREAAREARVARAAREAAREARVAAREAAEETREDREETETATLRRALEEATSSLRVLSSAIEASRGTLAGDGVDFADLQRTLGRLGVQPAVPAAQSGSGSPEQSTASSSEPGTSSVAESQAQSPETESEQQDASPSSTAVEPASPATETQTPDTPSANTTLIDSTSSTPFSPSPTTTLNEEIDFAFGRRTVTGECGICLLALRNGEALTWCQSQCGQNFHAGCIQRWVETDEYTQTCPNWWVPSLYGAVFLWVWLICCV